jgi:hypothetical protein
MVTVRHLPPESGRIRRLRRMAWAACEKAMPAASTVTCRVSESLWRFRSLLRPPFAIIKRDGAVDLASMPEATPDVDCNFEVCKNDVGSPAYAGKRAAVYTVAKAAAVQNPAELHLGTRIPRSACRHTSSLAVVAHCSLRLAKLDDPLPTAEEPECELWQARESDPSTRATSTESRSWQPRISGYRTSVLSRPSQRVTVLAVTRQSVMPRLRGLR